MKETWRHIWICRSHEIVLALITTLAGIHVSEIVTFTPCHVVMRVASYSLPGKAGSLLKPRFADVTLAWSSSPLMPREKVMHLKDRIKLDGPGDIPVARGDIHCCWTQCSTRAN